MKRGFLDGYSTYDSSDGFGSPDEWRDAFYQRMGIEEAERLLNHHGQTPHSILEIRPNATPDEIKAAFRRLVKEWHPDRNSHRLQEAEEQTKRIIAAFTKLSSK